MREWGGGEGGREGGREREGREGGREGGRARATYCIYMSYCNCLTYGRQCHRTRIQMTAPTGWRSQCQIPLESAGEECRW